MQDDPQTICQLCGRAVPPRLLTLHHLTPKQKGGKAEHRTPLCRPCHGQVHATFSNTDLVQSYRTIDSLRQSPQLQPFLHWIRKQNPDRSFTVRSSRPERIRIRRRSH